MPKASNGTNGSTVEKPVFLTIKRSVEYLTNQGYEITAQTLRNALKNRDEFANGNHETRIVEDTGYPLVYVSRDALDQYRRNREQEAITGVARPNGKRKYAVFLSADEVTAWHAGTLDTPNVELTLAHPKRKADGTSDTTEQPEATTADQAGTDTDEGMATHEQHDLIEQGEIVDVGV